MPLRDQKNIFAYFLTKYDPEKLILNFIKRVSLVLCLCMLLYFFIPKSLLLWNYLFISYASYICLIRPFTYRAQLFGIFWIFSVIILLTSDLLRGYMTFSIVLILMTSYLLAYATADTIFARLFSCTISLMSTAIFSNPIPYGYQLETLLSFVYCGALFFLIVILPKFDYDKCLYGISKFLCLYLSEICKDMLYKSPSLADMENMKNKFLLTIDNNFSKGKQLISSATLLQIWNLYCFNFVLLVNTSYKILLQLKNLEHTYDKYAHVKVAIETLIFLISGLALLSTKDFLQKLKELDSITSSLSSELESMQSSNTFRMYEIIILLGSSSYSVLKLKNMITILPQ